LAAAYALHEVAVTAVTEVNCEYAIDELPSARNMCGCCDTSLDGHVWDVCALVDCAKLQR
jgi:hypothetical protein